MLYIACSNKNVYKYILDEENEKKVKALNAHANLITSMSLELNDEYLLVGTNDGLVYIWDT